jgi:WD repeat-containing protein 48
VHDKLHNIGQSAQDRKSQESSGSQASQFADKEPGQQKVLPSGLSVDREYEILCNEQVLNTGMTLAAVRQYVWRNAGELVMHYRAKDA